MTKADEYQFTGEISINKATYPVAFNLNTITEAEDLMEDSITVFSAGRARTKHVRALVYAALREGARLKSKSKKYDPVITPESVGALLSPNTMGTTLNDIMALMRQYQDADPNVLAPFVPTPKEVLDQLFAVVDVKDKTVEDLGCGRGDVLLAAARAGAAHVIGYETDEDRFYISAGRLGQLRGTETPELVVTLAQTLLQEATVSDADVLFIYLLQDSNKKIQAKLGTEMKAGSLLVSHDFTMPGWQVTAEHIFAVGERNHRFTVYTIGTNTPVE